MTADLPQFYFRIRDNGASVFRVDTENRQRRIEMVEIASVNVKNGTIKPHGDAGLTAPELAVIKNWPVGLSILDMAWGTVLSGLATVAGKLGMDYLNR